MSERPPAPAGDALRLIAEREKTHGNFKDVATVSEALREALHAAPGWPGLSVRQREALHMMATKQARIVCGDPDFPDHWRDIGGFAVLGAGDDALAAAPGVVRFHDPRLRP